MGNAWVQCSRGFATPRMMRAGLSIQFACTSYAFAHHLNLAHRPLVLLYLRAPPLPAPASGYNRLLRPGVV